MISVGSTSASQTPWGSPPTPDESCTHSPLITAEQLRGVREPPRRPLFLGNRTDALSLEHALRSAAVGPSDEAWVPPSWLHPHQVRAARRVRASIERFGGALLADAVGLGKTYVALAIARSYDTSTVVLPSTLRSQWENSTTKLRIAHVQFVSIEALSHGVDLPSASLIVVDEAHRLRNPGTRCYDQFVRGVAGADVLLVTATPVVNSVRDLVSLVRTFTTDHAFAISGVRSLERAAAARAYVDIARATAPAIVARPAHVIPEATALPRVRNHQIVRAPPVRTSVLDRLVSSIDRLRFPTVAAEADARLLRHHLLFRLASSADAAAETAQRHRVYAQRVIDAAERGERLTRSVANSVFSFDDELRLELGSLQQPVPNFHLAVWENELLRLMRIVTLSRKPSRSPKLEALALLLSKRHGRKTVVFTTSMATALLAARQLGWRRVAVVGRGRARIASGQISTEEALDLFAPKARGKRRPPASAALDTLIATDFASEGLNLQDADAVVHLDLPWSPLRLEQRLGRIARMNSGHPTAEVHWFAPPPAIEARLRLSERLAQKAQQQLRLSVPSTSRVGRAGLINQQLADREALSERTEPRLGTQPSYAVVQGPAIGAVALLWRFDATAIPELLAVTADSVVYEPVSIARILGVLLDCGSSRRPVPRSLVNQLSETMTGRYRAFYRGPCSSVGKQLARKIVQTARGAANERNRTLLRVLDSALDRVQGGLRVGAERNLSSALGNPSIDQLQRWLAREATRTCPEPSVVVRAAVFGDGSHQASI